MHVNERYCHIWSYSSTVLSMSSRVVVVHVCFCCSTDACRPSPCKHIGWCRRSFNGGYKCVCRKGYSGKNCEIGEYRCVTVQCIRCTFESQTMSILVELTEFKRRGTKWIVFFINMFLYVLIVTLLFPFLAKWEPPFEYFTRSICCTYLNSRPISSAETISHVATKCYVNYTRLKYLV